MSSLNNRSEMWRKSRGHVLTFPETNCKNKSRRHVWARVFMTYGMEPFFTGCTCNNLYMVVLIFDINHNLETNWILITLPCPFQCYSRWYPWQSYWSRRWEARWLIEAGNNFVSSHRFCLTKNMYRIGNLLIIDFREKAHSWLMIFATFIWAGACWGLSWVVCKNKDVLCYCRCFVGCRFLCQSWWWRACKYR